MIKPIDDFLNSITMYRLILYGLILLSGMGIAFSFLKILPYNGIALLISLLIIVGTCGVANILFSKIFKAPTNIESTYITALILFLILLPPTKTPELLFLILASVAAIASKYIIAINKKHIFNPVVIALLVIGAAGSYSSIWWVSSTPMFPFILLVGFLVVRKIRRFSMVSIFITTSFATVMTYGIISGVNLIQLAQQIITSWPILFFATIMLTEPLTTPPTQKARMIYAIITGITISLQFQLGPIHPTPEFALAIGNIYSFIVSPKQKFILSLKRKTQIASGIYEFAFNSNQKPHFHAGQYLEWTLPHDKSDDRGNRRYFTIASSPTEEDILIGVKINENDSSSYKKSLLNLNEGTKLAASQLAGDFIVPLHKQKDNLVFIAGGIGITPFRSIAKYITDQNIKVDITLFYTCSSPNEFAYKDIFDNAEKLGLKTVYIITHPENALSGWQGEKGHLDEALIKKYIKDAKQNTYYISGPNMMVNSYKKLLGNLGVGRLRIITDYFPGF